MNRLTEAQAEALRRLASDPNGWTGLRPGSNYWPLTYFEMPAGEVDGEMVDELARLGLVSARPARIVDVLIGIPEEEIPDIDVEFEWDLTPAGRAALASPASKEDADA